MPQAIHSARGQIPQNRDRKSPVYSVFYNLLTISGNIVSFMASLCIATRWTPDPRQPSSACGPNPCRSTPDWQGGKRNPGSANLPRSAAGVFFELTMM